MCFSLLLERFLGVFTSKSTTFFIDVQMGMDGKGHQRPSFINVMFFLIGIECWWHCKLCMLPSFRDRLLSQREDLSRLGILFGLLPLSSINMLHAIGEGFDF
jgi:hypothetical protein